jgi:response regulator RpfG family c-di-GMP phosphodiesterase
LDERENLPVFVAVVDDEVDLANLFKEALSQIPNVRVFAFTDPALALEHFQQNQRNYRCVISDYRMPELNGVELLNKINRINPEVRSILMSAFEIEDQLFKTCDCIDKFLRKPVTIANLLAVVQKYVTKMEIEKQEN